MYKRALSVPKTHFFLFGPRGTGKSSWLRDEFKADLTIDLLRATTFIELKSNPDHLRQQVLALPPKSRVVIDEVQKLPELLDEVHALIFATENKYQFALTGSSARKLKRAHANLLAGRAITKEFFPLTIDELGDTQSVSELLRFGSLPQAVTSRSVEEKIEYLTSYVETYLKEEIRQEALTRNIDQFYRFLQVSALMNGQITNWTGLARDIGASRSTVVNYFEILRDTLVGWSLPAWQPRAKVKEVAHPKFYWFDTGVLNALTAKIHDPIAQADRGFLFETFVCNQIRALNSLSAIKAEMFYWRTESGTEVDLILKRGKKCLGIEIKSSEKWRPEYHRGLSTLIEGKIIQTGIGIYGGRERLKVDKQITVYPTKEFMEVIRRFFND